MFRDNFTDFAFNDIESKNMHVWITNARDLQEQLAPSFKDSFIVPSQGDGRRYAGTTIESQTLTVKCAAVEITEKERRNISQWLNPRAVGALTFGFDPYHYYNVKVASEIVADKWVRGRYHKELGGYTYIYNFTIKFTTTDDWCKLGFPINLDMQGDYFGFSHSEEPFMYRGWNDSEKGNLYSNYNNSYALPYLYPELNCYIHHPNTTDTTITNGSSLYEDVDIYNARFDQPQTEVPEGYFVTSDYKTIKKLMICNPGNEPMYINFFWSTINDSEGLQCFLKIDEEEIFNFSYYDNQYYFSNINYDSYVGTITDNGVLISLVMSDSYKPMLLSNTYRNTGCFSIPSGHPETIKLKDTANITVFNGVSQSLRFIEFDSSEFIFEHYGPCILTFFDKLPKHSNRYSVNNHYDVINSLESNSLRTYSGFVTPTSSKDKVRILLNSIGNSAEEIIYKYMSICDAHYLDFPNSNREEVVKTDEVLTISLQTRGN